MLVWQNYINVRRHKWEYKVITKVRNDLYVYDINSSKDTVWQFYIHRKNTWIIHNNALNKIFLSYIFHFISFICISYSVILYCKLTKPGKVKYFKIWVYIYCVIICRCFAKYMWKITPLKFYAAIRFLSLVLCIAGILLYYFLCGCCINNSSWFLQLCEIVKVI